MKAIIVKLNDKIVLCEQVKEITTKQFLDLQKEAKKTIEEKDHKVLMLENHIMELYENLKEANERINNLQHQINVITGVEEESEEHE